MEKREIHDIVKQIYLHVQQDYDSQPVSVELIKKSQKKLDLFKLSKPQSKRGQELYALMNKAIELSIVLPKEGQLVSIEQGLSLLKLLRDFEVVDRGLAKEEQIKKDLELYTQIQEEFHRKLQQTEAYVAEMIKKRIQLEREWLEFLEKKRSEEEKEKDRLMRAALFLLNKLFEELEASTAFTKVRLDNGNVVDIYHRDIFRSPEYKKLHKDYVEGNISFEQFNRKEQEIVLQRVQFIAQQRYGSSVKQSDAVKVYHATRDEKQKAVHYDAFVDAVEEIGYTKEEKLDTRTVRVDKDYRAEKQEHHAEEQEHHAEEVHEEEVEKNKVKRNIDIQKTGSLEIDETDITDALDELDDLFNEVQKESIEITKVAPQDALHVGEKMIHTLESSPVLSRSKKIENKNNPDVDPESILPSPSP